MGLCQMCKLDGSGQSGSPEWWIKLKIFPCWGAGRPRNLDNQSRVIRNRSGSQAQDRRSLLFQEWLNSVVGLVEEGLPTLKPTRAA